MSWHFVVLLAAYSLCFDISKALSDNETSTLQLVHILFRHGDRTNERRSLYPKDPYINETYYPYGLGELTNEGKRRQFKLGKALRQRYGKFLPRIYTPDILEAISSGANRTRASLLLVLAGLFPPVDELIWETGLSWQPIPYSSTPTDRDKLFFGILCPTFEKLYQEHVASPRLVHEFKQYQRFFNYLSENTGWTVRSYYDAFFIYVGLKSQAEFGLELPDWTAKVYPKPLEDAAIKLYSLFTGNTGLKRLSSGYLLKKIVEDTQAKRLNTLVPQSRKIFLYSGHEFNIGSILRTLEVFNKPHLPPYSSYISFEYHKIDGVDGIKIFYQDYSAEKPHILKLPACDEFCPLEKFVSFVAEFLPEEDLCGY